MFRKLSAIEIAEGALLADIAIVFQLLTLYLPIGGDFFRLLIFIVFAILVLRRGLYVGVMGMIVALFLSAIMVGPQLVAIMLLEATGRSFPGLHHETSLVPFLIAADRHYVWGTCTIHRYLSEYISYSDYHSIRSFVVCIMHITLL